MRRNLTWGVVCVLPLVLQSVAAAQSAPARPKSAVTVVTVKPEMYQEWFDIQRNEVAPALKKAGLTRTVWRNAPFSGNPYEFVMISPMTSYAQYDQPNPFIAAVGAEAAARIQSKVRKCLASTTTFVTNGRPDLSNPRPADAGPPTESRIIQ